MRQSSSPHSPSRLFSRHPPGVRRPPLRGRRGRTRSWPLQIHGSKLSLGEPVRITLEITNRSPETVRLTFSTGQRFDSLAGKCVGPGGLAVVGWALIHSGAGRRGVETIFRRPPLRRHHSRAPQPGPLYPPRTNHLDQPDFARFCSLPSTLKPFVSERPQSRGAAFWAEADFLTAGAGRASRRKARVCRIESALSGPIARRRTKLCPTPS